MFTKNHILFNIFSLLVVVDMCYIIVIDKEVFVMENVIKDNYDLLATVIGALYIMKITKSKLKQRLTVIHSKYLEK